MIGDRINNAVHSQSKSKSLLNFLPPLHHSPSLISCHITQFCTTQHEDCTLNHLRCDHVNLFTAESNNYSHNKCVSVCVNIVWWLDDLKNYNCLISRGPASSCSLGEEQLSSFTTFNTSRSHCHDLEQVHTDGWNSLLQMSHDAVQKGNGEDRHSCRILKWTADGTEKKKTEVGCKGRFRFICSVCEVQVAVAV